MKHKFSCYLILLFAYYSCTKNAEQTADNLGVKPNIIILMADDLGYGDLSCYGSQSIYTPNIDALAAEGKRFTHFYAGAAVCTPSRACLLTGKYPLRYNIRRHFTDRQEHLPTSSTTLAELLKANGYQTAHIGKWHLGGLRPKDYEARQAGKAANPGPLQHGFDHSLTSIEGAPIRPQLIKDRQLYRKGGQFLVRNDEHIPAIAEHWTDIKINEGIRLIEQYQEKNQPFFINFWFDVPHTPYEPAPEPHLSKYEKMGISGEQLYFRSMVSHLDANIGRLIDYLKQEKIFNNTLLLFTSDNGPAFQGSPGPFKGGKTDLHEGGIRVPMFAVWKDYIPANTHSFHTIHMADLLPTLIEVAGISINELEIDGESQLEALTTANTSERKLFWQMDLYKSFQNQGPKPAPYATVVMLERHWKLLANEDGPSELFNLNQDHRELYNLIEKHPKRVERMYTDLQTFLQSPRDSSGLVELGKD